MSNQTAFDKSWSIKEGLRIDRAFRLVWQAAPQWTIVSTSLLVIQSLVPLAMLYILKVIVDRLTKSGVDLGANESFEGLLILIGIAFGVAVIGNLCNAIVGYSNMIQTHLVTDHMQRLIQAKSIEVDLNYYENAQYFDKMHRAQRGAPSRPVSILQGFTELIRNSLTLLGALIVLLTFHWGIVTAVFVASLPVVIYRLQQADNVYALYREKTAAERLCGYFNQVITTGDYAKEVRIFGFGYLMANRFSELRNKIRTSLCQISIQGYRRQFITESTAALAGFGSLIFIAHAAFQKAISLGELVMYFGAFQVALGSLRPTLGGLGKLYENNLFLSALYEFLRIPKSVPEPSQPKPMPHPWHRGIKVENLSFHYPGTEQLILNDINLAIHPGEIVALVGLNGSGKTTLTKLLCRLYDPSTGCITVDGSDLREFKTDDLRREIGVIHQDFGRYHMTARENILLGCSTLDRNDPIITQAAQWAGIHDDLMGLSQGYDTMLSRTLADGEELSIGQWQKLALARSLVRNTQLIILDEPTSSLDATAEFELFEKFRAMVHGRSAFIISHRFSTVRLADRIYVLNKSRIIEQGSHQDLLASDGLYAELFHKQAANYQNISQLSDYDKKQAINVDLTQ